MQAYDAARFDPPAPLEDATATGPAGSETRYSVVVLEVQ